MDFTTEASQALDQSDTVLRARGEIAKGDFNRFVSHIQINPPSTKVLVITSLGGSVYEAMQIAAAIKSLAFSVVVEGECASACAQIIFPAGEYSILTVGSVLGIHSCSRAGERNELCNQEIADLAVSNGFPYGTIDMFADLYGPGDMKWMTEISARCFGFYRGSNDPKPINGKKACVDGYIYTMGTTAKPRPFGPSFDCERASIRIEKLLCMDKELMQTDSILGRVYDHALSKRSIEQRAALKKVQIAWIKARNKECDSLIGVNLSFQATREAAICTYRRNESRIYELIGGLGSGAL